MKEYKKYIVYLLFFLLAFGLLWISLRDGAGPLRKHYTTMGTYLSFTVVPGGPGAREAVQKARAEVERINKVFSTYRSSSLTSKVNNNPDSFVRVTEEFVRLLRRAEALHKKTDGHFDITVGPLVELWGFYQSENDVPTPGEITRRSRLVGFDLVTFTDTAVKLERKGMKIDFGALAKGYAVDRAVDVLRQAGQRNFLVDLGGNIYAAGSGPGGSPWSIGVQNPRQDNLDGVLELEDEAVGTSGDYERTFVRNGERYSHIINPRTGRPVKGMASTTVVAESAQRADLYSTALFLTGGKTTWQQPPIDKYLYIKAGPDELSYFATDKFMEKVSDVKQGLSRVEVINP